MAEDDEFNIQIDRGNDYSEQGTSESLPSQERKDAAQKTWFRAICGAVVLSGLAFCIHHFMVTHNAYTSSVARYSPGKTLAIYFTIGLVLGAGYAIWKNSQRP